MIKTRTNISGLLNNLVDMQESPAYAVRKQVLVSAEQTLLFLDAENAKLHAEVAKLLIDLAIFKRGLYQLASLHGLEEWKRERLAEAKQAGRDEAGGGQCN